MVELALSASRAAAMIVVPTWYTVASVLKIARVRQHHSLRLAFMLIASIRVGVRVGSKPFVTHGREQAGDISHLVNGFTSARVLGDDKA